ncbi:MAG: peroxidase family protein, partial [bacterium]
MIWQILRQCRRRPHPFSMVHDYTSWTSLTDKKFSARHLRAKKLPNLPPIPKILEIFRRGSDGPVFCEKSTCLFPAFAQYLTDGFVRTRMPLGNESDEVRKQTTSNNDIDMCPLYGRLPQQTLALRRLSEKSGEKGRLKSQMLETDMGENEEYPPFLLDESGNIKPEFEVLDLPLGLNRVTDPDVKRVVFAVGGDRVNAVPTVSLFNTLFLREHNRVAGEIEKANPGWDDERVFQTSRNVIIVLFIKLVVEEYINHIRPEPAEFVVDPSVAWKAAWNKPNWITTEFSLLYRWHSLIPDELQFSGVKYSIDRLIMNNRPTISGGLAQGFIDLSNQKAGKLGVGNTNQWIMPQEQFAIDQGRLCELASYGDYCEYVSLPRPKSFEDITKSSTTIKILEANYASVDDVEFYVGLFAE